MTSHVACCRVSHSLPRTVLYRFPTRHFTAQVTLHLRVLPSLLRMSSIRCTLYFDPACKTFGIVGLPRIVCENILNFAGKENGMPLVVRPYDSTSNTYAIIKLIESNLNFDGARWRYEQTRIFKCGHPELQERASPLHELAKNQR